MDKKEEEVITVIVQFTPKTGQMQFQTPRDPIVALGMLQMATREVYRLMDTNQAPAAGQKIVMPTAADLAAVK